MNSNPSLFLQFVKHDMVQETNNNYQPVIIKALVESGFEGEIRSRMAKPPFLSIEEMHKKLTQANLGKPDFDVQEAVKTAIRSLKPFVSVSPTAFGLRLEFSAAEIPEILEICEREISLK
jgi:hypothetical protein